MAYKSQPSQEHSRTSKHERRQNMVHTITLGRIHVYFYQLGFKASIRFWYIWMPDEITNEIFHLRNK